MKPISEYAGLKVFEAIFFLSIALLLYSAVEKCLITSVVLFTVGYISYCVIRSKTAKYLKSDGKHVLITGCDSGFGKGLAKYLHDFGFHVIATCLNVNGHGATELKNTNSDRLRVLYMDVGKDESVADCLKKVEDICGETGLWGLVNNAGINFLGDVEFCTMKQYLDVGNVNMYGMVRVTKAFLPLIRQTKGRVVNVTSCKGLQAIACNSVYCITKYGVEAFSDILRQEMKRFGIKVAIIEPGNFGGLTGCLNEDGIHRIKNDMDAMWTNASEEIKEVYGREYHDGIFKAASESASTTCPTMDPVLEAFKDSLLNVDPQERYLISGGTGFIDLYTMLAKLSPFVPVCIMDKILLNQHMKGLPPLKIFNNKDKQL